MTNDRDQRTPSGVALLVPTVDDPVVPALLHPLVLRLLAAGFEPVLRADRTTAPRETAPDSLSGLVVVQVPEGTPLDAPVPDEIPRGALTLVIPAAGTGRPSATHLGPDDIAGAEVAVRHLVELGHRRLGYVSGPSRHLGHRARALAFERAVAELVPDAPPTEVVVQSTLEDGARAGRRLLAAGCTAVVCASDVLALGVVAAVRDAGLEVPRDVSVVGNGDTVFVAQADPPLTTVRHPFSRLVRTALEVLVAARDGGLGDGVLDELLFRPELIIRRSTGAVPTCGGAA